MLTDDLNERDPRLAEALRDSVARTAAVVGLSGVALIHLLDAPGTFAAAPYKGWLYAALIVSSLATAAVLLRRSDSRAWAAAGLLSLGACAAFVFSRTIGLPAGADDIGNWWEPLGLASLFVEGSLVALSAGVLYERAVASAPRSARSFQYGEQVAARSLR
jgi:hypothetical protein